MAQVVYYAAVAAVASAATWQVAQQVFLPEPPAGPAPFTSCEQGLRALHASIERARRAAEKEPSAEDNPGGADRRSSAASKLGDEAALLRYRAEIEPTWRHRDAVERLCAKRHEGILDSIERLRYSEEHGVRHQAAELSSLRKRVTTQIAKSLPSQQRD